MSGRFNLNEYITVQERINQFWKDHETGRIITTLESDPSNFETCRYRAEVYVADDQLRPSATGYAFEIAGGGMANKTSHEENCETSAIGRALANLGYATSQKDRPSREEMHKASRDEPPAPQRVDTRKYGAAADNAPQDAPFPRQMNPANANEPATANQVKAIFGIGKGRGMTPDEVKAWVLEQFAGKGIDDLTRSEASAVISNWQGDA